MEPKFAPQIDWSNYYSEDWLARRVEQIIEPELAITDPHHHFWRQTGYMVPELLANIGSGHNVVATVYLETNHGYLTDGPEHLRPSGEGAHVVRLIKEARLPRGAPDICAGIVGMVDLTLDAALVDDALDAHIAAADGRFRGVRLNATWDETVGWDPRDRQGKMADPALRAGLSRVGAKDLACDVMCFHPQLPELAALARAVPETLIVADHCGGPLGVGHYTDRAAEVFAVWRAGIAELASCPNVRMKLGGLASPYFSGWMFANDAVPPSSEALATAYRPWFDACVDAFGAERCMFESNFPADKPQCSYPVLWNAFKRLAAGASAEEKRLLLGGTANAAYRIG